MKKDASIHKERKNVCHPRDRKVRQLEKKEKHILKKENRRINQKNERAKRAMRFLWFRKQCQALGSHPMSEEEIILLTQLYINRHLDELAELKTRINLPKGRITEIQSCLADELSQFQGSGFEVPVLSNSDDVEILTQIWDGIPETSCVVETEFVQSSESIDEGKLQALKKRLVSLEEIRQEALNVIPQRLAKKSLKLQETRKNVKKSVKKMDTPEEIRHRIAVKRTKKQKERNKAESRAVLAGLRGSRE